MPYFITDDCVLCGVCEAGCDVNAISETEEKMVIDQEVCIECGICYNNCPFDAIIEVSEEELAELMEA